MIKSQRSLHLASHKSAEHACHHAIMQTEAALPIEMGHENTCSIGVTIKQFIL